MAFIPVAPVGEQLYFQGKLYLGTRDGNAGIQLVSEKDVANGYAGLDSQGKIEPDDIPDLDGGVL